MYKNDNVSREKFKLCQYELHKREKEKSISLLGQLDGESMIQAVVMSELLGKPKAKRRRRGW